MKLLSINDAWMISSRTLVFNIPKSLLLSAISVPKETNISNILFKHIFSIIAVVLIVYTEALQFIYNLKLYEFLNLVDAILIHLFGTYGVLATACLIAWHIAECKGFKNKAFPSFGRTLAPIVLILWLIWYGFNNNFLLPVNPKTLSSEYTFVFLTAVSIGLIAFENYSVQFNDLKHSQFVLAIFISLFGCTMSTYIMASVSLIRNNLSIAFISPIISFLDIVKVHKPYRAIAVLLILNISEILPIAIFANNPIFSILKFLISLSSYAFLYLITIYCVLYTLKKILKISISIKEKLEDLDSKNISIVANKSIRMNGY